jgi:hypothetical protein
MNNFFTRKKIFPLQPSCIAAMIIVVILMSVVFYLLHKSAVIPPQQALIAERFTNDVNPVEQKAMLTLNDGTEILLVDSINGMLATEGTRKTKVTKQKGWLTYDKSPIGDSMLFNTLTVPMASNYKLLLPDGTRVWVNANTTIKYPLSYGRQERKVWLSGEAYFEVADLAGQLPFIVQAQSAPGRVAVRYGKAMLNVNAYEEARSVYVTVLNGDVNISNNTGNISLQAGQGGFVDQGGRLARIDSVSARETIAWKEGLFSFKEARIQQVMEKLARWYNVQVDYNEQINSRFTAVLDINTPLSHSLQLLETAGNIRFRLDGNRVTVMRW